MTELANYTKKIAEYYGKTKNTDRLIKSCMEKIQKKIKNNKEISKLLEQNASIMFESNKIKDLFDIYFQMIEKILRYNKKIEEIYEDDSLKDLYNKTLKRKSNLKNRYREFRLWLTAYNKMIKNMGKLYKERCVCIEDKSKIEINKKKKRLEILENIHKSAVYKLKNLIGFIFSLVEAMGNINNMTDLYNIRCEINNLNYNPEEPIMIEEYRRLFNSINDKISEEMRSNYLEEDIKSIITFFDEIISNQYINNDKEYIQYVKSIESLDKKIRMNNNKYEQGKNDLLRHIDNIILLE
jgi:uncharacterized protein YozE (UPF0346 family)